MTDRPLRLQDIAARAGVSPITVSRVIRAPDLVSPDTRRRVEEAIDLAGYIPNAVAGSLASSQTRLVVAIFPNLRNVLFSETVTGLAEVLVEHGYQLVVGSIERSPELEEKLIASFMAHRPCALFLHRTQHTDRTRNMLLRARIPVVESGNFVANPIDSVVSFSHQAATAALAGHFIERGRRRIAFVGSERSDRHDSQLEGYRTALQRVGLEVDGRKILDVAHSYVGGRSAIQALMKLETPPDAVVFSSAVTAAGGLIECDQNGVPVPGRLAIGSLDDSELAPHLTPSLTAIKVSRERIGQTAAQIIVDRLLGNRESSRIEIEFELVVRGSS